MRQDAPPRRRSAKIADGCFALVVRAFVQSPKFLGYAPGTQELWRTQLDLAARPEILGAISIYELRPALMQAFLDGLSDRPAKQKAALSALRQLEKWALVRDLLPYPITLGCEAAGEIGGHTPWTDEQVVLGEAGARDFLARVITLAANTGQRGSDLIRIGPTDVEVYKGRPGHNVIQQKTGRRVWVPMTEPLMAAMESWERRPGPYLLKADGTPWQSREQLTATWIWERDTRPAIEPLKAAGLVIHGLRGTACVRLLRAGANTRQISDMVGMSEQMVARYTRFSEQKDNALAAVIHLDRTPRERSKDESGKTGS